MSYKDFLGNAPPKLTPDLVESDEEDDEMPDLVTMDTAVIPWNHIKTGYIFFTIDHSPSPHPFSPCVIIKGGPGDTFAPLGYFEESFYRVDM